MPLKMRPIKKPHLFIPVDELIRTEFEGPGGEGGHGRDWTEQFMMFDMEDTWREVNEY
jgi:hypothetical protein